MTSAYLIFSVKDQIKKAPRHQEKKDGKQQIMVFTSSAESAIIRRQFKDAYS
jgi:hypothetical protein